MFKKYPFPSIHSQTQFHNNKIVMCVFIKKDTLFAYYLLKYMIWIILRLRISVIPPLLSHSGLGTISRLLEFVCKTAYMDLPEVYMK